MLTEYKTIKTHFLLKNYNSKHLLITLMYVYLRYILLGIFLEFGIIKLN